MILFPILLLFSNSILIRVRAPLCILMCFLSLPFLLLTQEYYEITTSLQPKHVPLYLKTAVKPIAEHEIKPSGTSILYYLFTSNLQACPISLLFPFSVKVISTCFIHPSVIWALCETTHTWWIGAGIIQCLSGFETLQSIQILLVKRSRPVTDNEVLWEQI